MAMLHSQPFRAVPRFEGEGLALLCRLGAFTHFLCFVIVRLFLSSITVKFPTEKFQHEEGF